MREAATTGAQASGEATARQSRAEQSGGGRQTRTSVDLYTDISKRHLKHVMLIGRFVFGCWDAFALSLKSRDDALTSATAPRPSPPVLHHSGVNGGVFSTHSTLYYRILRKHVTLLSHQTRKSSPALQILVHPNVRHPSVLHMVQMR